MIVKKKDGYYVLSEKSRRNLGGPYKTREEAKKESAKSNTSNTLRSETNSYLTIYCIDFKYYPNRVRCAFEYGT